MTIQYCSDLHLEFAENRKFLSRRPLDPAGDILILAGDIIPFGNMADARDFIDFASDHFSAVYWVPGNHEYYGFDITEKPSPLFEKIRDNFYLVNNQAIVSGNVKILFTTLWSRISPQNEWDIQRSISDFSTIKENGQKFTAHRFSGLHQECLNFLATSLKKGGPEQTVVVSHHVPTLMNYPAVYRNSPLNEAFAVELFDLIQHSNIAYWIYGHHHINTPAFTIGKTGMITNQLGYVRHYEHGLFRREAVVEL